MAATEGHASDEPAVLSVAACPTNPGLRRTHIRCRRVFQERVEQTATGLDTRGSFRVERATDDFNSREEFSASRSLIGKLTQICPGLEVGLTAVSSKGKLKRRLNERFCLAGTCLNINQITGIMENRAL